jgi:hypothetical protein
MRFRRNRVAVAALLGALALGSVGGAAVASTPADSGTLSPPPSGQSVTVQWTGTLPGGANADSACTGQNPLAEDHHTVTLSVPSNFAKKHTLLAAFSLAPDVPTADVILSVRSPNGTFTSSDNVGVGGTELVALFNPASGAFDAVSCTFAGGPMTYHGTLTLTTDPPSGTPGGRSAGTTKPTYRDYAAPAGLGDDAGEPSIGVDWKTNAANGGTVMYQAGLETLRVSLDSAGNAAWQDVSSVNTSVLSLDPIMDVDAVHGRTFVSQLTGQDSLFAFSDDDGGSWTPGQGGGIPSGVDHQSVGNGPYPAGSTFAPLTSYPNAVYYCSQDLEAAFCARSDTGGLTFNQGVPIYTSACGGLHGHVRVSPDGTVYVPNKDCGGHQGVAVSTDVGESWTVRTVPTSLPGLSDPSVAAGADNTVYFGYADGDGHAKVAVSGNRGQTWSTPVDVGAVFGIQNAVFPEIIAGDGDRAAFAFLGTRTAGNPQAAGFGDANNDGVYDGGEWHLYIATTYDRGKTWTTVDATPKDPVQRGPICLGGISCSDARNLLDFNDIAVDKAGHIVAAYADGCTGTCVTSTQTAANTRTAKATFARQVSGTGLFASTG